MIRELRVGDKIICIDTENDQSLSLKKGEEYIVREILVDLYISLENIPKFIYKNWRFKHAE